MASKANNSSVDISHIEIRTIAHATEDLEKVEKAFFTLLPPGTWKLKETKAQGHHGNAITILELRVQRRQLKLKVLEHIKQNLPVSDLSLLRGEVEERTDRLGFFHFRVDKQQAYLDRIRLASRHSDTISVKVKLQSYPANRENIIQGVLKLLDQSNTNEQY